MAMTGLKGLHPSTSPHHHMWDGVYCEFRGFHSDIIEYAGGVGCGVALWGQRSKLHVPPKMEIRSFETPGTSYPAMQRHNLEERNLRGLCSSSSVHSKKQK
jgi:hypothetical protein